MQDNDNYIILKFDRLEVLPKPTQQRSVLIKNAVLPIVSKAVYPKNDWKATKLPYEFDVIYHFLKNRNNHTTSNWNCIGIRVTPMI